MKKEFIIKSSDEFNIILNYNHKISNNEFIIFYFPNNTNKTMFGISAPKKIGNAVLRNKCKRRLRMMIKNNILLFKNDRKYIIIIKKGFLNLSFWDNNESLKTLIGGLNEK